MTVYVMRKGKMVDKRTGEPMPEGTGKAYEFRGNFVTRAADKNPYRSPIDGRPITSHHERQEDLKRNGCREVDPSECVHKRDGYNNKAFAEKRGLKYTPAPVKKEKEVIMPDIVVPD